MRHTVALMEVKLILFMPEFLKSVRLEFMAGVNTWKLDKSTAVLIELICVSMSPMYC